jgi:transcriptional regulator with XRE-family HTH domain
MTMQKLAALSGISPSFLAYIEHNGRKASLETIDRLAGSLQIQVHELFMDLPEESKEDALSVGCARFKSLVRGLDERRLDAVLASVKAICKAFAADA